MSRESYRNLPDHLCRLAGAELALAASDAELVHRFCDRQEEAAFELIIRRHGPLVWDVCRNLLDVHDAEDAFQATFLVLARKAGSIRKHESLASWLYGVAYRVSIRARTSRYRQRVKEREAAAMSRSRSPGEESGSDERALVYEELSRLPDHYRRVIVLCHFQGLSCAQAAAQLGCRAGTVKSRLSRGREALRQRLVRRGLAVPAAAMLTAATPAPVTALPVRLLAPTAEAAARLARGEAVAGLLSARVLTLSDAVGRSLAAGRPAILLGSLTVLGLIGVGALLASAPRPEAPPKLPPSPMAAAPDEPDPPPAAEFAFPAIHRDGVPATRLSVLRLAVRSFWQGPQPGPIAFSPDGKLLASGGPAVRIMNAQTGGDDFPLEDVAGHVSFSPDGRYLAVADGGSVALFLARELGPDPRRWNMRRLGRPSPGAGSDAGTGFVAFSADSRFVAVPDDDHSIVVFDVESRQEHRRLRGHDKAVRAGEFSPDGRTLATAGADRTVRFWDIPSGIERHRLSGHREAVQAIAFDKDGTRLASGSADRSIILWNAATGTKERELHGHEGGILALAFSPEDGALVSSASDRTVRFWNAASGTGQGRLANVRGVARDLAFTPGDGLLAVADGRVRFWHPRSGVEQRINNKRLDPVTSADFSPDGSILATAGGSEEVRLWDRATGRDLGRLQSRHGPVAVLTFAPDRDVLFTAGASGVVTAWDLVRGLCSDIYRGHPGPVREIAVAADGRSVATAGDDAIHLWESASGKILLRIEPGSPGRRCMAFTPDSRSLAVGSADGAVRLSDLNGRLAPRTIVSLGEPVEMIAFTPDGRLLTGGSEVRLWDEAGHLLRRYPDSRSPFALNADGTTLAAAARLNPTRLFDVASATPFRENGVQAGTIRVIAFAGDGQSLISAGDDSTLVLWNDPEFYRRNPIPDDELERLGDELIGNDSLKVTRARQRLLASPAQAVDRVRRLFEPARVGSPELENCLRDLSHRDPLIRSRAAAELHRLRLFNQPGLRHIAENHADSGLRSCAVEVLRRQRVGVTMRDRILLRAPLDLLGSLNHPDAIAMLGEMARGDADLWLTREARLAIQRWKIRSDGQSTD